MPNLVDIIGNISEQHHADQSEAEIEKVIMMAEVHGLSFFLHGRSVSGWIKEAAPSPATPFRDSACDRATASNGAMVLFPVI
jgi:hypothetical protein